MANYNPRVEYFNRKNKTQRNNERKKENHNYTNSIGGCSCNYITSTTSEQNKRRELK